MKQGAISSLLNNLPEKFLNQNGLQALLAMEPSMPMHAYMMHGSDPIYRMAGCKDRHNKVLTSKGIRDRRIRLSVPTAIQFYDLQDRVGFEQPSKAVDRLIDISKLAIDELPVLDAEMETSAFAGNVINLIRSNIICVEHCIASPTESATAAAASALRFGPGSLEHEWTSSRKAMKDSDMGRSSSSTSDGSIKELVKHYTSKYLMSKPCSKIDARFKETEQAKKKIGLCKNLWALRSFSGQDNIKHEDNGA